MSGAAISLTSAKDEVYFTATCYEDWHERFNDDPENNAMRDPRVCRAKTPYEQLRLRTRHEYVLRLLVAP